MRRKQVCLWRQVLHLTRQPHRTNWSHHNITVKFRCGCISCYKKYCPSFLPRIPDGRDITGRPWQGCHNSAASFYTCAAGFPLKSVGGREKVSLAPALSSRPDCQSGSKASVHRSDSLSTSPPTSCRHRAGPYAATHAGFVPVIPCIQFSMISRSRGIACPSNNHEISGDHFRGITDGFSKIFPCSAAHVE